VGLFGWQHYAVVDASIIQRKVSNRLPLSTSLGVLGLNGLTAYFGLEVAQAAGGDIVCVSTAAGAVGSWARQIAKIQGCRTIGIVGSDDKVRMCVEEFGYDAAINYRNADLGEALGAAAPDGVDVYFDNTSGRISDAVVPRLRVGGRVAICGTVSIT